MIRKTLMVSGLFIISLVVFTFFLTQTNLYQTLRITTLSRPKTEATPKSEVYIPIVSNENDHKDNAVDASNLDATPQSSATPIGDEVNANEPETFNLTPVPTVPIPSFEPVSAELDKIKFETVAQLELAKSEMPFFGNISWSPDSSHFVGEFSSVISGTQTNQIYIGDTQSAKVSLWRQNAYFPFWNRENCAIIYLKPRVNEPLLEIENGWSRNYYDLVMGLIDSQNDEILLRDVIPPYAPLQQYLQTAQGNLVALDSSHRLVVWPPPDELAQMEKQGIQPAPIADLSALVGISEPSQVPMFDETDPTFSLDPSGVRAIVARTGQSAFLLDMMAAKLERQIDAAIMPPNVAWSTDGKLAAFTNSQGLFVYDLNTGDINRLISREDIGFIKEGIGDGFSSPAWAFDNQVILFMASSSDWVQPGTEDRVEFYTLATTRDGKSWKAISDMDLISISPLGSHAIVRTRSDSNSTIFQLVNILR
ncbi:MAG: hypothetical protein R2911_25100 [Caldilineaceae bacterium]